MIDLLVKKNQSFWRRTLAFVWKHECRAVKYGCWLAKARMRFSVMVHSTSSSWMITSFFSTLIANTSWVFLCSAIITCNDNEVHRHSPTALKRQHKDFTFSCHYSEFHGSEIGPIVRWWKSTTSESKSNGKRNFFESFMLRLKWKTDFTRKRHPE